MAVALQIKKQPQKARQNSGDQINRQRSRGTGNIGQSDQNIVKIKISDHIFILFFLRQNSKLRRQSLRRLIGF
jgi:hypothetical protein